MQSLTNINAKPWKKARLPRKILFIRLQAMGDVVITLPYINSLKKKLKFTDETVEIDFLTREETAEIPQKTAIFDRVFVLKGERSNKKQWLYALTLLPWLLQRKYDIVVDLQNNSISRFIRRALFARAWSEFDKYSKISAGKRNEKTINAVFHENLKNSSPTLKTNFFEPLKLSKSQSTETKINDLLTKNGWDESKKIVLINPAGAFESRNWELKNYIRFAELWLQEFPETQFLMMGIDKIMEKSWLFKEIFKEKALILVNQTSTYEAYYIINKVQIVLY